MCYAILLANLENQDSTGPEKLDIQENSTYCHVMKYRPEPLYNNISEVNLHAYMSVIMTIFVIIYMIVFHMTSYSVIHTHRLILHIF